MDWDVFMEVQLLLSKEHQILAENCREDEAKTRHENKTEDYNTCSCTWLDGCHCGAAMTTEPQDTTLEDKAETEDKDEAEAHYWATEDKVKAHRMAAKNETRACQEAAIRSLRRRGRSCNIRCKGHTL